MAHVRVENLVKHFDEVIAVNGISLQVRDREFTVFLGPSGSGKTTTLRAIAGLEQPDRGDIFIDDVRVNDLPPADLPPSTWRRPDKWDQSPRRSAPQAA